MSHNPHRPINVDDLVLADAFVTALRAYLAPPHWVWQLETFATDADQEAFIALMTGRATNTGPVDIPGCGT